MIKTIAGYDYGEQQVSRSPVSLEEHERLKQTVTLTDRDCINCDLRAMH